MFCLIKKITIICVSGFVWLLNAFVLLKSQCVCITWYPLAINDGPIIILRIERRRIFGLVLMLNVPVNSYVHVGTVSTPNHTIFLGKLD